ncbi:MAG: cellobiose epimerase [Verrucomicrobiota bacterium]|nr:cellobiose epimerase [Verrucomicrobiota bacterium]
MPVTPDDLLRSIEADLRGNILPFWLRHAVNGPARTFHGQLGNDLSVDPGVERGALLSSRILWTYAAAFRAYGDPAHRTMADLALEDLMNRFHDAQHGGFFWSIQADGTVKRDRKQVYGQAFAIYALSEYHAATGDRRALDQAVAVFLLLEHHARERVHGGYLEAFARDWSSIADMRLSEVDQNDPKSQNTMLHVMEAYTRLLQLWPDAGLRVALRDLVGLMLARIVDARTGHLGLFFTTDWRPTSDKISYGHDIEAAWLLTRAADVLGEADLSARTRALALKIADVTLAEGTDPDGGIVNLGDPVGIVDGAKEWWPQAEAVVGFLNAWQISGEARYFAAAAKTWDFIATRLIDREHGEWFRGVTRGGALIPTHEKVGFWKCPYHNGRMGLEVMTRLRTGGGTV